MYEGLGFPPALGSLTIRALGRGLSPKPTRGDVCIQCESLGGRRDGAYRQH